MEKFGDSPAGDAELTINIPVRYLEIDIVSTTTESSEHMQQWYPGVVTDSVRYAAANLPHFKKKNIHLFSFLEL